MTCKNCNEFHKKEYGSGIFCSERCARSFAAKHAVGFKKAVCKKCNLEIYVDIRASLKSSFCYDCKKIMKLERQWRWRKFKGCPYCGEMICKRKDICKRGRITLNLIKYFGFDKKTIGTNKFYEEFDRIKNILEDKYINDKMSIPEMAERYGHPNKGNFDKLLRSLGVKIRTLNKSILNAFITGRNKLKQQNVFPYKNGWHISWEGKKFWYRSSYELDYMKELDDNKVEYEVENLRIAYWDSQKQKERMAFPDFYLVETNEIKEIKSTWTLDIQNMKDKFEAYKKLGFKPSLILEHKEVDLNNLPVA